jgi:hypothetical protein
MLRDNIIVGSMTLADLGYPGVEDISAGVVFHIDPQPWDAPNDDPSRPPGGDAEVAIADDWLIPFTENWKRAVVYRHNNPKMCDIYYTAPDGAKLRSHNEALKYFVNNPDPSILPSQLCWSKKPIGLNNLFYETIRQAKKRETKPPPLPNSDPLELSTNAFEPWSEVRDQNVKAEYNISTQVAESKEDVFLRKSREYREEIETVKSCSARKRAAKDREATHTSPNQGATWVSIDAKMNLAPEFIIPDYNSTPEDKGGTDFSCKYENITDPHMRKGRPEDNHANFTRSQ